MIQDRHRGAHNELIATVWLLKAGYEVFRNVSQHGPIDIVAMKDGELLKFDVKASGPIDRVARLSEEQISLGVKLLRVYPDGECEIVNNPLPPFVGRFEKTCKRCGVDIIARNPRQVFCSGDCRTRHYLERGASECPAVADSGPPVR